MSEKHVRLGCASALEQHEDGLAEAIARFIIAYPADGILTAKQRQMRNRIVEKTVEVTELTSKYQESLREEQSA